MAADETGGRTVRALLGLGLLLAVAAQAVAGADESLLRLERPAFRLSDGMAWMLHQGSGRHALLAITDRFDAPVVDLVLSGERTGWDLSLPGRARRLSAGDYTATLDSSGATLHHDFRIEYQHADGSPAATALQRSTSWTNAALLSTSFPGAGMVLGLMVCYGGTDGFRPCGRNAGRVIWGGAAASFAIGTALCLGPIRWTFLRKMARQNSPDDLSPKERRDLVALVSLAARPTKRERGQERQRIQTEKQLALEQALKTLQLVSNVVAVGERATWRVAQSWGESSTLYFENADGVPIGGIELHGRETAWDLTVPPAPWPLPGGVYRLRLDGPGGVTCYLFDLRYEPPDGRSAVARISLRPS